MTLSIHANRFCMNTTSSQKSPCVFLLQLGGPETLADIEPFLYNLLSDILPLPRFLKYPLAKLIAKLRTPKVAPLYKSIGGGSPLRKNTEAQAQALQKTLPDASIFVCMRYAHPRAQDVVAQARALGPRPWVLLPLYPQYSFATTRSSVDEFLSHITPHEKNTTQIISHYEKDTHYIQAMCARIQEALSAWPVQEQPNVHLFFSAHGLPMSFVKKGDPYPAHIQTTTSEILKHFPNHTHSLAYQSRVGPAKWLAPSCIDAIQQRAQEGIKNILVIPVSFVSEHIETLSELDIELKHIAEAAGISHYKRARTVGTHPDFIQALYARIKSLPYNGTNVSTSK